MKNLNNYLNESLLDDEKDLIENDDIIIIRNIVDKLSTDPVIPVEYVKGKGIIINGPLGKTFQRNLISILNEQDLTIFSCEGCYFLGYDISWANQLRIKKAGYLYIDNVASKYINEKTLKIDELKNMTINLRDTDNNWLKLFRYIHPKILNFNGSYLLQGKDEHPIDIIKNIKIDTLILSSSLFPDTKKTRTYEKFILSENNVKYLDNIYENNSFSELKIINQGNNQTYYKILKSPRSKLGYKLVNITK